MRTADLVDLEGARAGIEQYQRELRERGVSVLPGFVRAESIDAMVVECDTLAAEAYHQDVQGTPYLELPADGWPEGHPRVTWGRSSVHTIGYDQFPADSLVRALYESDELLELLARILEREPLYRYADPIGALNLAVMIEGDVLDWHFDQTDFVVSLAIQSSERGGDFENAALMRSPSEENYEAVAAVLGGDAPDVVVEPMTPGTLMLFEGRHSLHRVSPVEGTRPRYVALFGYDTKPDTMSSELLKQIRYGRSEPLAAR
ncbi:MAG: hypothetical protein QOI95_1906 [Acidimicrobiaceae bacterium]|jgi:hypothetical protein